jgi:RND family efflux transporter MFP subunit
MVLRVAMARLRFFAVFAVAALTIGYWDQIKNHVDKWTRPPVAPDNLIHATAGEIEYYCPMHPDVVRAEPGKCPKCGMPLVKRHRGEAVKLPPDVLARVQLTPQRVALANVHTTAVDYRPLTREVKVLGVLDYDETRLARLSARVAGRADELFATYTGQEVKKGDPIYSIYSPDVYTAQREYLLARKRVNDLPKESAAEAKADATAIYNASLQKLVLWGVTQGQLDQLDEEFDRTGRVPDHLTVTAPLGGIVVRKDINQGQYVQAGDAPYTVADLSRLWLQLKLYERDLPLVNIGDAVEVSVDAFPGQTFGGAVTFKAFQLDAQTRTLDARVEIDNFDLRLRPGMFAAVVVRAPVAAASGLATRPATSTHDATTRPAVPPAPAVAYQAALRSYMKAQRLLAGDKADGVASQIAETASALDAVKDAPVVAPNYQRLAAAAAAQGQSLADLRQTFKEVSAAMIELGKSLGTPADSPPVKVFRCPMKKANWLQDHNDVANPYYGSEMFDCGSAVETLPKTTLKAPATRSSTVPTGRILAVPRTAVIETGSNQIVYVESSPGVFDMTAVKLGPAAGDHYPVLDGLDEGDRVVTVGTFLVDAENRLNPTRMNAASPTGTPAPSGHQH